MSHPMGHRRHRSPLRTMVFLVIVGIIVGVAAVYFSTRDNETTESVENQTADDSETGPDAQVEPQPTAAPPINTPIDRQIFFPNAETAGNIVQAYRQPGGWDVSNLQQLVGHLEGTPWIGEGGNIVLAGHFEDELGRPGPFRYLYFANVGDRILLQDGADAPLHVYEVRQVFRTDPNDLEVLRKSENEKLTLITCDAWSYETETYQERLVVVAEPIGTVDETTAAQALVQQ